MNCTLQTIFKKTQPVMMKKRKMTFIVITLYQESNCSSPKKIHFSDEIHRRYQNNIYVTGRNAGETYCWNVDGKRELFGAWTNFTRFLLFRPVDVCPNMRTLMSDAAKKKAKQRLAVEKPKLDNARKLRRIFFIEPTDEDFTVRRKLEVPMPPAMPCKIPTKRSGESHRKILGNARQNTLVLLMPTKARDQGQKELDTALVKITLLLQSPNAKAAVVKEGENCRKFQHGS